MTSVARTIGGSGMSIESFRVFQERQPDGQRWELVDGIPVMMTPPKIGHQKIAWNLTRLLNETLAHHDPSLIAIMTPGIDLGLKPAAVTDLGKGSLYVPELDIAVIENTPDPEQRIVGAALLLAEIVSRTDEIRLLKGGQSWIEVKAALYRQHAPCEAVLVIEQERVEARLWQRTGGTWSEMVLSEPDGRLIIGCCGLNCTLSELYAHTHLARTAMTAAKD